MIQKHSYRHQNSYGNRYSAPKSNWSKGPRFNKRSMSMADLMHAIEVGKRHVEGAVTEKYCPKHTFAEFTICDQLKRNISFKKFTQPTAIQDETIPAILEGKDVIGVANTGTGKTAAFLISLINKVFNDRTQKVLIVTPTRELAVQIDEEFRNYSQGMGVRSALCIGGTSIYRQKKDLGFNPNFVIGTPGRLKDHMKQRHLNLALFNNVVLDEADRMVDMGFIEDIKFIIGFLPKARQSLFFSATISPKVKTVIQLFVQDPITISVKHTETSENIDQQLVRVPSDKKVEHLQSLLAQETFEKVLIFGRTKWGVQRLADELVKKGFRAGAIHGDKRQNQRQEILTQFKRNEISILLATDVASRGLDIKNVSHVINYDLPETYDDYIHRIGRTGRADKKGIALTFVD
ncbi:MAG: hypothetical protein ACD_22C00221G0003 [uncultured bacterium]|nr:MAG: hypothetical protein ACD_22C00221G0003 [uncultured bacterium]